MAQKCRVQVALRSAFQFALNGGNQKLCSIDSLCARDFAAATW